MPVEADLVRTDRQTHRPTTVTLASACARRGLIIRMYHGRILSIIVVAMTDLKAFAVSVGLSLIVAAKWSLLASYTRNWFTRSSLSVLT